MGGHDLIMAMGEGGLGVHWSKIKIWTLGNKAKRACKFKQKISNPATPKKTKCKVRKAKNQGVTLNPQSSMTLFLGVASK